MERLYILQLIEVIAFKRFYKAHKIDLYKKLDSCNYPIESE